jgi:integrase
MNVWGTPYDPNMTPRQHEGQVRETPKGSGKYRALLPRRLSPSRAAIDGRFDSAMEARRALNAAIADIDRGRDAAPGARRGGPVRKVKHAVGEYITARTADRRAPLAARTVQAYRGSLQNHICHPQANLGEAALSKLTSGAVNKWSSDLAAAGVGPDSIEHARRVLAAALNWEVEHERLLRNPMSAIRIRTTKASRNAQQRDPVLVPTWEELATLVAAPERHEDRLLLALLAFGGLRWSEATSLEVRSLEPVPSTIAVERVLTHTTSTGWVVESVKGGLSHRVFVPRRLMGELVNLGETRADEVPHELAGRLLFRAPNASERGGIGMLDSSNFRRLVWEPARIAAGLNGDPSAPRMSPRSRPMTVKDLRASAASFLIDAGATRFEAAQQLRHSSPRTTDQYYTRALEERHHSPARAEIRNQAHLSLHERLNAMFEAWVEEGGEPLKSALFGPDGARFGATSEPAA